MSRIGKQPISMPPGVTVNFDPKKITISGSKGSLEQFIMPGVTVTQQADQILVTRDNDLAQNRSKHGLMRSLLNNMVTGVSRGFERKLEINGVGYRVSSQANSLKFNLGYSHEIIYTVPAGINASVDQNNITISGISKQQVGQVAAEIRALKKPEPYKGKGIKYSDEQIIRKSGKSGKE